MRRILAWLVLSCLSTAAASAEERVAVVNLEFAGVSAAQERLWREAMVSALESRGMQVISDANLRYVAETSKELFACFSEERCRTEIGRRLQADLLLTGRISRENDELQANLSLHAVDLGTTAKNQLVHCPGCSTQTFRERLTETVSDLVAAERALQRATMLVHTKPPGAKLTLDGRPVGSGEMELTVIAGAHHLVAALDGRPPVPVDVDVKPGERLEVDVKLPEAAPVQAPVATALPPPPRPHSWWSARRIAGVALVAAGGVMLVTGIPFAALDGDCAISSCAERYSGEPAGGALIGVGAAVAAAGAIVLVLSRHTPVRASITPAPGGASLVGEVRF